VAIVAGIARASRAGVLIKGGVHLEALGGLRAVAFDKTGTLTEGRPTVTDVLPLDGRSADSALALAAAVEERSEHPLAGAILAAARARGLAWPEPASFEALPGRGARAVVDGETVVVGGPALIPADAAALAALADLQAAGKTALLVGVDGRPVGVVGVADRVRPGAAEVVAALRTAGVRSVAMLTGDNRRTAEAVARQVGVDEIRAELLPAEKQAAVAGLLAEHGRVAMVGDGVNDAPALATATVGVAMGAAGSDTALETADVALMADDLTRLPFALRLGRSALATIWANVGFAVAVKAVFLALTLVGLSNLWLAILADTGAALLVIANSMRLLRFPDGPE
jgi:Cd2+/Zn2+-exporting ATPase